jgi:hypothetical protein
MINDASSVKWKSSIQNSEEIWGDIDAKNNEDVNNYDGNDYDDDVEDDNDDNDDDNEDNDDDDNDSTPTELLTNGQTASLEENQECMMICCTI